MRPETKPEISNTLNPEEWVDQYADLLFSYSLARVNDVQYAEDIVQSVFLSAWKARESFTGEAAEKTWLFAICKNKIIDYYRKNSGYHPDSLDEALYFDHTGHWTASAAPGEWGDAAEVPGQQKEFFSILRICTGKMKTVQQKVFAMKYLDEMKTEDICSVLDISLSNYWVLIHRAKLHLRDCLEKNWLQFK